MTGVYLLHFSPPLHHASHYLGYASDIDARLARHLRGEGSKLMRAVVGTGRRIELARVWEGATKDDERRMKKTKAVGRVYCPICGQGREEI